MDTCKVYQIFYDEGSKAACYPEFEHIENKECSPFFENTVIAKLIQEGRHSESEYFGVFSANFKYKMTVSKDSKKINPNLIFQSLDTDVVSFFRNHKNKNVVNKADVFHPGFKRALNNILKAIGFEVDLEKDTRFTVYQNHFIAKSHIYEQYVKELLIPAMNEMCNKANKELQNIIWQDSNYHKKKTMSDKLKKEMGVPYYPYHTFICERLFSVFLNKYTHITCKHL
jgi:hypothetical protein